MVVLQRAFGPRHQQVGGGRLADAPRPPRSRRGFARRWRRRGACFKRAKRESTIFARAGEKGRCACPACLSCAAQPGKGATRIRPEMARMREKRARALCIRPIKPDFSRAAKSRTQPRKRRGIALAAAIFLQGQTEHLCPRSSPRSNSVIDERNFMASGSPKISFERSAFDGVDETGAFAQAGAKNGMGQIGFRLRQRSYGVESRRRREARDPRSAERRTRSNGWSCAPHATRRAHRQSPCSARR